MHPSAIRDASRPQLKPLSSTEADNAFQTLSRESLLALLRLLEAQGYDFVAPTPSTHARVVARAEHDQGRGIRDVLGWSLPFKADALPDDVFAALNAAGVIEERKDGLFEAVVRVSFVYGSLFLHSSYPTVAEDSVFLGPDSYRFADFIVRNMAGLPPHARILDYGAGAGVGGIIAGRNHGNAAVTLADVNPKALFLASINAEMAGLDHGVVSAKSPNDVDGTFDLIVTHPPFMMDEGHRAYRDGGDLHGARLSLDWVLQATPKLAPGGRLILHTGVSIVDGRDVLLEELRARLPELGVAYSYRVLDPDIFGDELDRPAYADVERIAAVGLCVTRPTVSLDD